MSRLFLFLLCISLVPLAFADDDEKDPFADIVITSELVRGPVHALRGAGGTIGVSVGEDGILLVDDQFAPLADRIKAAVAELQPGPVDFIINTHWHGDHTGGNASYEDVVILSHDNVRERLISGAGKREGKPADHWPVITFDETVTLHFNGEAIEVMHFPHAHTDGDAVVFFTESNVVHVGDLFFYGAYPYVDLDSGGNATGVLGAVNDVLSKIQDDTKVILGHGASVLAKRDLVEYRDFLQLALDHVRAGMESGTSREALMEQGMPAGYWDEWEEGWIKEDQYISFVYDSLK